jgi:hypothetical protein
MRAAANQRMKLTGAAILVSRGMKVLQAAPAAYPYRSALGSFSCCKNGTGFYLAVDRLACGSRFREVTTCPLKVRSSSVRDAPGWSRRNHQDPRCGINGTVTPPI